MAKGTQTQAMLYRAVRFEIHPNAQQQVVLQAISDNLFLVWNEALEERVRMFDTHIAPLYERLKNSHSKDGEREIRRSIRDGFRTHSITLFDQINALTSLNVARKRVPRNWQEETLDALDGAFKSFVALRKNGDYTARPPRMRYEWDFSEIPGRFGFKIADGTITLRCEKIAGGTALCFPIPEYQSMKLTGGTRVKKFTLFRDEKDMRKPGRFWISLVYESVQPHVVPFIPEHAVFVSLGASSIGVVSPKGESVYQLWRPDKYWKPKIDALEERMKSRTKGSRGWLRLKKAQRTMHRKMAAQQKLDQREIVARELLSHGVHFVVTDIVIRSKKGALADASKKERSGQLGLNWSAQNTGSIARLVAQLEEKVKEHGGSVQKHRLTGALPQEKGHENKLAMARLLRESFLAGQ